MELDLSDLLQSAEDKGLLKKKKRSSKSPAKNREVSTYVPVQDRYKSISLVMLQHVTVCDCCGAEWHSPNQPLLKRLTPKGDLHYSDTFTTEEFKSLPREMEYKHHKVMTCATCFNDENWMPVQLPPNNDKEYLITQLLQEAEENDYED